MRFARREDACCFVLGYDAVYCPLFKGMHLTCTVCVESVTIGTTVGGCCQKHACLSLQGGGGFPNKCWLPAFRCSVYNKPNVKFLHSSNHAEHNKKANCVLSHAQNTTLLPNVFLTLVHRLLVTNKRLSDSFNEINCQGQMQTL